MAKFTSEQITEFYDLYFQKIYQYHYYKVLSIEAAEDLTGETFLAFAEQIKKKAEIDNPRAFLYGIAYRKLQDYLRAKYKLPMASVDLDSIQIVAEVDDFVQKQKTLAPEEKIMLIIDKLPEQQREIIELRLYEKLNLQEICIKIGKDMSYVKTTQNRAIKRLKILLSGIPDATNIVEE